MESRPTSAPHSVKRWQLGGTDYDPAAGVHNLRSQTRFSAWTPLNNQTNNLQVRNVCVKRVKCVFNSSQQMAGSDNVSGASVETLFILI